MKIFQDIFSDQQLLSDSYKIVMLYNDVIGQVQSRMVVKKDGDVDIGCGNAFGGTNEQQEGGNTGEAPVAKVNDLVDAFGYEQTNLDWAGFNSYFRQYMKKLLAKFKTDKPDRIDGFKQGAKQFFTWAKEHFSELTFYTGANYDLQNAIVISYYKKEEDEAPAFLYVMDGFKSYKV